MIDGWTTAGMEAIGLYASKGGGLGVGVLNGVPARRRRKPKRREGWATPLKTDSS